MQQHTLEHTKKLHNRNHFKIPRVMNMTVKRRRKQTQKSSRKLMKNYRQQLLVTSQSPIVFHTAIIKVMEIKLVMLNIIKVNIHLVIDLCAAFNVLSFSIFHSFRVRYMRTDLFYVASNDLRYNRKIARTELMGNSVAKSHKNVDEECE